ncbi:hypothetical protein [Bacillus sp. OTU530]|uniref:hypothetical protein n=1 Tax=Bacillus sp. OTU530 TaxID=3043862 RepID=UPI00313F3137
MSDWRQAMYDSVKQIQFSRGIDSKEKVFDFFKEEFKGLIQPLSYYEGVCEIRIEENEARFIIGKNGLLLHENSDNGYIGVYISRISSSSQDFEEWGAIYFNNPTYIEMKLPAIQKGKKLYLDSNVVDVLFKAAFETVWID